MKFPLVKTRELILIASIVGFVLGFFIEKNPWITVRQITVAAISLPAIWIETVCSAGEEVFQRYVSTTTNYKSNSADFFATHFPFWSGKGEYAAVDEAVPETKAGRVRVELPGVTVAKGLLSVDVGNMSLQWLLEEIGKRCHIGISWKNILADKFVSARFNNMVLEEGLRELMRVSGVKNYALIYGDNVEGRNPVKHLFILPHDSEISIDYSVGEAKQEVNT